MGNQTARAAQEMVKDGEGALMRPRILFCVNLRAFCLHSYCPRANFARLAWNVGKMRQLKYIVGLGGEKVCLRYGGVHELA